jgi:glycosyltransferase involved in cell wall biosynthesis
MPDAPAVWDVDGVEYRQLPHASADMFIRRVRPRVLVTHHHLAPGAISLAKTIGARSVLVQHNDHAAQARFVLARPNLVIYNTDWVRESLRERWLEVDQVPGSVVRPPVSLDEHRTEITGDAVTLVNLSQNKGVETWRATAGLLPDLPFLGVTGAHGPQETRLVPPNARVIPQTSDMRADVWARTRVLLMPSVYESYGMVAVEALASSIPVVAHPTPGLVEALGDAATFIDRDDHQAWAEAIRSLYRGGRRRGAAQKAAWDRSAFLEERTRSELQHWVSTVLELVSRR